MKTIFDELTELNEINAEDNEYDDLLAGYGLKHNIKRIDYPDGYMLVLSWYDEQEDEVYTWYKDVCGGEIVKDFNDKEKITEEEIEKWKKYIDDFVKVPLTNPITPGDYIYKTTTTGTTPNDYMTWVSTTSEPYWTSEDNSKTYTWPSNTTTTPSYYDWIKKLESKMEIPIYDPKCN